MAIGTNRHSIVHTVAGRHFVQTATSAGLPDKMVDDVMAEFCDTAASSIDRTLAALPKGFPEKIAASIADGAKRRLTALAVTRREG
jgi:serine/threonine-protein kinase HipA